MLIAIYETAGMNQEVFTAWSAVNGIDPNSARLPIVVDTEARLIHFIQVSPADDSEMEKAIPNGGARSVKFYMREPLPLPFVAEAVQIGTRRALDVLPEVNHG